MGVTDVVRLDAPSLIPTERGLFLWKDNPPLAVCIFGERGGAHLEEVPMMEIRPSRSRGNADFGWLRSQHTFSFGEWYDPRYTGFGHLRVINEDHVAPSRGFGTHSHRNMEIISYVIGGELGHKDTMGNGSIIRPGDVQVMSAGTGVAHSEMNPSSTREVHFLQIWIIPRAGGTAPRYAQKHFEPVPGLTHLVSADGADGSVVIGQDADIWRVLLPPGAEGVHSFQRNRGWLQVIRGSLVANGVALAHGDGLSLDGDRSVVMVAESDVEALIFDLV